MLGLGETHDEIIDTMYDLKDAVRAALTSLAGDKHTLFILRLLYWMSPVLVDSTHTLHY